MKKLMLLLMLLSCTEKESTFTILHYNIKELKTSKIEDNGNNQVNSLISFLNKQDFDILSLNEVEYKATNLQTLNEKLSRDDLKSQILVKANTGKNSTKDSPDIVNFGRTPGEYSNGALTNFPIKDKKIIVDLNWKDFFNDDFKNYKLSSGESIPNNIELFDKSFSDILLDINDKEIHLILLHTVPSYGFGNPKTINFLRNQRQIEFLKWYLNRDNKSQPRVGISPLSSKDSFIVVGDLNVDINSKTAGAKVLRSIIQDNNSWIPIEEMDYTHPNPKLMLDYIIMSKDIEPIKGKVFTEISADISDHLPIWAKFKLI